MKYYSVKINRKLDSNPQSFWSVLANRFGEISEISDGVINSKYITQQKDGVGTTRYCELPRKGFAKERVTIWDELKEFEFEVLDTSMPVEKGGKLNFKIQLINESQIEVDVYGTFRLKKFAFLSPMLKPMLLKIIKKMLKDFELEINKTES